MYVFLGHLAMALLAEVDYLEAFNEATCGN